ncbi:MAG: hypothetical protein WEA09_02805 [Gemmatimonadota bacterium]
MCLAVGGCQDAILPVAPPAPPLIEGTLFPGWWERVPRLPVGADASGAVVFGEELIVVGGWDATQERGTQTVLRMDLGWVRLGWEPLPEFPEAVVAPSLVVGDGILFAAAGVQGSIQSEGEAESPGGIWRYDPAVRTWESLGPLPHPRTHVRAVWAHDRLVVLGGRRASGEVARVEAEPHDNPLRPMLYDPQTGEWELGAAMPSDPQGSPRLDPVVVEVFGLIYVLGGRTPGGELFEDILMYEPRRDLWTRWRDPVPLPQDHMTAAVLNNRIHLLGGSDSGQGTTVHQVFDPATGEWERLRDLPEPRARAAAVSFAGSLVSLGGRAELSPATPPAFTVDVFHFP